MKLKQNSFKTVLKLFCLTYSMSVTNARRFFAVGSSGTGEVFECEKRAYRRSKRISKQNSPIVGLVTLTFHLLTFKWVKTGKVH